MENPGSWTLAEHVVNKALEEHDMLMRHEPGLCGLSVVRKITDALRAEGLLISDQQNETVITPEKVSRLFHDA